jgi:hypothetical protein
VESFSRSLLISSCALVKGTLSSQKLLQARLRPSGRTKKEQSVLVRTGVFDLLAWLGHAGLLGARWDS